MGTFFIGDLHLGHKKILKLKKGRSQFDSIEEHDEFIVDSWNNKIRKKDVVFVHGDVAMTKESLKHLGRLKGRKKLIMGNHDHFGIDWYLPYFENIFGVIKWKHGVILSHMPVHTQTIKEPRFTLNIHGHSHKRLVTYIGTPIADRRYFNVTIEHIGYVPLNWDEIKQKIK